MFVAAVDVVEAVDLGFAFGDGAAATDLIPPEATFRRGNTIRTERGSNRPFRHAQGHLSMEITVNEVAGARPSLQSTDI